LLHPTCVDCAKFLAAASRRSLGRVSVPVWLIILSDQLWIVALVGRYPTNKLIHRRTLQKRIAALVRRPYAVLASLSGSCPPLLGRSLRVTHPSATRAEAPVRLACVRHAANVYPEPGSNSPLRVKSHPPKWEITCFKCLTQIRTQHNPLPTRKSRTCSVLCQDPGLTGITVQILPAIQMLMCAAAPRATNRDATKPEPVSQLSWRDFKKHSWRNVRLERRRCQVFWEPVRGNLKIVAPEPLSASG